MRGVCGPDEELRLRHSLNHQPTTMNNSHQPTNQPTNQPPASYWTEAFARESGDHQAKVQQITEMGFGREDAERALAAAGGDENAALEALLGGS